MSTFEIRREFPPLPGYLYRPNSEGTFPGIIFLHGSEGGQGNFWSSGNDDPSAIGELGYIPTLARYFAAFGYVTYALSYFCAEKFDGYKEYPPIELAAVELRNTATALQWLKFSPFVGGKSVALWGASRGAEHALLLSTLLTTVLAARHGVGTLPDLIIADSPPERVFPGLTKAAAQSISTGKVYSEPLPDAWQFAGISISTNSPIEIERVPRPMLITYGAKDQVWGPTVNPKKLHENVLKKNKVSHHFDYSNAQDPTKLLSEISSIVTKKNQFSDPLFVRYLDEGHFPSQGSNSAALSFQLVALFLKTFCNNT